MNRNQFSECCSSREQKTIEIIHVSRESVNIFCFIFVQCKYNSHEIIFQTKEQLKLYRLWCKQIDKYLAVSRNSFLSKSQIYSSVACLDFFSYLVAFFFCIQCFSRFLIRLLVISRQNDFGVVCAMDLARQLYLKINMKKKETNLV